MPIYEYRCNACGHHLEALQKMTDAPLRKCPDCGKQQLRRLVSASRFRLKGSGWYETDFKNDKEKKRNLVETAGGESSEPVSEKAPEAGANDDAGKTDTAKKTDADAPKAAPSTPVKTKLKSTKAAARPKPSARPRAKAVRG